MAAKVRLDVSTSPPALTPMSDKDRCNAAVPLERAAALADALLLRQLVLEASTCGPSGSIQFESKASSKSWRSTGPAWGGQVSKTSLPRPRLRCEAPSVGDQIPRRRLRPSLRRREQDAQGEMSTSRMTASISVLSG